MDLLLTRKPILNAKKQVVFYETQSEVNKDDNFEDNSLKEIASKYSNINLENKIFFNIKDEIFKEETINSFSRNKIGVSIYNNYVSIENLNYISKNLKENGFSILITDFILDENIEQLSNYLDYIKVDFKERLSIKQKENLTILKNNKIALIAANITSNREFARAKEAGFKYFAGTFYKKPALTANNLPSFKLNYLNLLREINKKEPDFDKIEYIIKNDISLSYNMFRLINSAYFGFRQEIQSIRQALVLLGLNDFKKWISMKIMRGLNEDKPDILFEYSLIRAHFAEDLAELFSIKDKQFNLFLMGLFSLIDVILSTNRSEIFSKLPIAVETKQAIMHKEGVMGDIYKLITAYEEANWSELRKITDEYAIDFNSLRNTYFAAVRKANIVINNLKD